MKPFDFQLIQFLTIVILYHLLMRRDVWFANHLVVVVALFFVWVFFFRTKDVLLSFGLTTFPIERFRLTMFWTYDVSD